MSRVEIDGAVSATADPACSRRAAMAGYFDAIIRAAAVADLRPRRQRRRDEDETSVGEQDMERPVGGAVMMAELSAVFEVESQQPVVEMRRARGFRPLLKRWMIRLRRDKPPVEEEEESEHGEDQPSASASDSEESSSVESLPEVAYATSNLTLVEPKSNERPRKKALGTLGATGNQAAPLREVCLTCQSQVDLLASKIHAHAVSCGHPPQRTESRSYSRETTTVAAASGVVTVAASSAGAVCAPVPLGSTSIAAPLPPDKSLDGCDDSSSLEVSSSESSPAASKSGGA